MSTWQTVVVAMSGWMAAGVLLPTFTWALRRKRTIEARRISRQHARIARVRADQKYADRMFDVSLNGALLRDPELLALAEKGSVELATKD